MATGTTTTADVIWSYYQTILMRDPTADEMSSWTASVDSHRLTLDQVRTALEALPEVRDFVAPIVRLYEAAFHRVPDADGLKFWVDNYRSGAATLDQIAEGFIHSAESIALYGSGGVSAAFVTALYLNVLGRAPDADGFDFWMNTKASPAEILVGFSQSAEFIQNTAGPIALFLDRAAQGDAGTYTGDLFDEAHNPPAGKTFTLTTGIDEGPDFTGGAGNDLFRGTDTTLTPFDSLDGGAGIDTLSLSLTNGVAAVPGGVSVSNIENILIRANGSVGDGEGNSFDISGWTGVQTVDVNAIGRTSDADLTVGDVDIVTVKAGRDVYLEAASATTIDVTAGQYANVHVTGDAGTISATATEGDANVYVDGDVTDSITVTASGDWSDANVVVEGSAGSITIDSSDDANVLVGMIGDLYDYVPSGSEGSVGTIAITAGDDAYVDVAGNAGSITVDAEDDATVYVGYNQYSDEDGWSGNGSAESIDVKAGYYAEVDVAGDAGSIKVDAGDDADVYVGWGGENGDAAGSAGTIDVTAGYDADIEVAGDAGSIKVDAGHDVDVQVGYTYPVEVEGQDDPEIVTVVSSVETLDIVADNDVTVGITGDAGDITIVAGRDADYRGEVDVEVGGSIDSLSITGAKDENWHGQAVDVSAASIGSLSLTDINEAYLDGDEVVPGDLQTVAVELTNSAELNLAIAGVQADLWVEGTGEDNDGNDTNVVATLGLTVNTFEKDFGTAEEPDPRTIDSYVALHSADVQTLNIDGGGNLELDVTCATALETIDAHEATGNITVELPGYEGAPVSYRGGSGVDHVILDALPEAAGTGWNFTVDGGEGDADKLTLGASLASEAAVLGSHGAITNFEILELTGVEDAVRNAGTGVAVDATLFGTNHVILDGAGPYEAMGDAFHLTIGDAGTVEVGGDGLLDVTVVPEGDSTGSLNLVLNGDAQGEPIFEGATLYGIDLQTTVRGAEAVSIESAGHGLELDVVNQTASATINAFGLTANEAKTVTITGDAFLDLTDDALSLVDSVFGLDNVFGTGGYINQTHLASVETIDASAFNAGLVLDLRGQGALDDNFNPAGVHIQVGNGLNVILASEGNDTIDVGDGSNSPTAPLSELFPVPNVGNIVWGGLGKDVINLGAGDGTSTAADILVYTDALESNGVNVDVINGFRASFVMGQDQDGHDILGHDLFDFTGLLGNGLMGVMYLGEVEGYAAANTALSDSVSDYLEVVFDTTTQQLYADVNNDGIISGPGDLVIKLAGVTDLSQENFHFFDLNPIT